MTFREKIAQYSLSAKLAVPAIVAFAVAAGWYSAEYLDSVVLAATSVAPLIWALIESIF